MYTLKGFMVLHNFIDNTPHVISPIGELSTYAKTFSTDILHYAEDQYAGVSLAVFHHNKDDAPVDTVAYAYSNRLLQIGQWVSDRAISRALPQDKSQFATMFLEVFDAEVSDLSVGDIAVEEAESDTPIYVPEYLKFSLINGPDTNEIKLWFSDHAFRLQYDEYTIKIVPPVDEVDELFGSTLHVKALLDQLDDTARMQRIQEAIDEQPPTTTVIQQYDWSNPLEPDIKLTTAWALIIYGPAGNNLDIIRQALMDYILERSSHDREAWDDYLPDLFKSTEFVITPLWDHYSIPNETTVKGLFSPIVKPMESLAKAKVTATRYPDAHVDAHAMISASLSRSVAFVAIGSPENRQALYSFYQKHPDYILVPTTSIEFGRMSPVTQEFVVLLSKMLAVADTMTLYSDIPIGMTRLIRDDIMYVVASHDMFQYLVVSRQSYEALFANEE